MAHRPPTFKQRRAPGTAAPTAQQGKASPSKRGYNAQWRKLRLVHLASNQLCVFCLKRGYTTAATVVDHIKAHKGDRHLLYDPNNLQSLCKPCHDRDKQQIEHGKRPQRWGVDGLPLPDLDDEE